MSKYDLVLLFPLIAFGIIMFISLFWESQDEIYERERREKHWEDARREQKEINRNCL
jgi:hypothetical protein